MQVKVSDRIIKLYESGHFYAVGAPEGITKMISLRALRFCAPMLLPPPEHGGGGDMMLRHRSIALLQ